MRVFTLVVAALFLAACSAAPEGEHADEGTNAGQASDLVGACGSLSLGQTLYRGDSIKSCDQRFTLTLQREDGNLVVYGPHGALWSTLTGPIDPYRNPRTTLGYGGLGDRATFQSDGNFVLYKDGSPTWNSGTFGHTGDATQLSFGNDGNIVVHLPNKTALWSWITGAFLPTVQAPSAIYEESYIPALGSCGARGIPFAVNYTIPAGTGACTLEGQGTGPGQAAILGYFTNLTGTGSVQMQIPGGQSLTFAFVDLNCANGAYATQNLRVGLVPPGYNCSPH